jgi:hypothetical protein
MIRIKDKEFVLKHNGLFIEKQREERRRLRKKWGEGILSEYNSFETFEEYVARKPIELHIPAKSYFKNKPTDPEHQEAWEDNSFITIYT